MFIIDILNQYSRLYHSPDQQFPEHIYEALKLATSYRKDGYAFTDAYIKGKWDGYERLGESRDYNHEFIFPTGLVPHVVSTLDVMKTIYVVIDLRTKPESQYASAKTLDGIEGLRDYQENMVASIERSLEDTVDFPLLSLTEEQKNHLTARVGRVSPFRVPGIGIWWAATGSGKTESAAGLIGKMGVRTLFVVYGNSLVKQTKKRFETRLHTWLTEHSLTVADCIEGDFRTGFITIAGLTTMTNILKNKKHENHKDLLAYLAKVDLFIFDEGHGSAAKNAYNLIMSCSAYYRVCMSGTPLDRPDDSNLKVIAGFGDIVHRSTNKEMVEKGVIPEATIRLIQIGGSSGGHARDWNDVYERGIVWYEPRNLRIIQLVQQYYEKDKKVLILFKSIPHGERLSDMLWTEKNADDEETFIAHTKLDGESSLEEREDALSSFREGKLRVLLASDIFQQGVDLPDIDVVINAAAGKSVIGVLQRFGRGLRGDNLILVDFADGQHATLAKHSLARLKIYKKQDCFNIISG